MQAPHATKKPFFGTWVLYRVPESCYNTAARVEDHAAERTSTMNSTRLAALSMGGLLYCRAGEAERILQSGCPELTSLALYLRDGLSESEAREEEQEIRRLLVSIRKAALSRCPMLFVRVGDAKQLMRIHKTLDDEEDLLMGYVLPRFSPENADEYLAALEKINSKRKHALYAMPVLETEDIACMLTRKKALEKLRKKLDAYKDTVLCLRAGVKSFCSVYGLNPQLTGMYPEVIRNIITDIISVFSPDYAVAGGEWGCTGSAESSLNTEKMKSCLVWERENGLLGGTVLSESLLEPFFDSMKVTRTEAEAAKAENREPEADASPLLPASSRWAEDILTRASVFGVTE